MAKFTDVAVKDQVGNPKIEEAEADRIDQNQLAVYTEDPGSYGLAAGDWYLITGNPDLRTRGQFMRSSPDLRRHDFKID